MHPAPTSNKQTWRRPHVGNRCNASVGRWCVLPVCCPSRELSETRLFTPLRLGIGAVSSGARPMTGRFLLSVLLWTVEASQLPPPSLFLERLLLQGDYERQEQLTSSPGAGRNLQSCAATCHGFTCDALNTYGYSCAMLRDQYGCDCVDCSCPNDPKEPSSPPLPPSPPSPPSPPPAACSDTYTGCPGWAADGSCYHTWFDENCQLSCCGCLVSTSGSEAAPLAAAGTASWYC